MMLIPQPFWDSPPHHMSLRPCSGEVPDPKSWRVMPFRAKIALRGPPYSRIASPSPSKMTVSADPLSIPNRDAS
jgi:hypothetical protein